MRRRFAIIAAVMWLPATGCATAGPADRGPSVIVHPDGESRAELARIVRQAMGGAPVELAADALTSSPVLALEHARPRDAAGRLFNGRERSRPETFELYKQGARCVLVQTSAGRSWVLRCASAAPVAAS
jgi:hypothetical protein